MSQRSFQPFSLVRFLLYPLTLLYGGVVWMRNRLYDSGFYASVSFSVPVICVGNLSTGGTGKTPHIEYLIRLLQYRYGVATMSRGYKRRTQGFILAGPESNAVRIGDEPMQFHMKFPEVAVSVSEERITGIPRLLQLRPDVEVVLLDDAFQHRSVKAGLNILITDYSRPYYEDHILPYGRLREGRRASQRADIIVVSKCPPALSSAEAEAVRNRIAPPPYQQVFFSAIRYEAPYDCFTNEPTELKQCHAILVCCIARPEPLVAHLEQITAGLHVLSYPDHHYFLTRDLEEIRSAIAAWEVPNKVIVTTEKDATRLMLLQEQVRAWGIPVVVLPISVYILLGQQQAFDTLVNTYVEQAIAENQSVWDEGGNPAE